VNRAVRDAFGRAVRDYAALRNRGYPERALLKLVSDRHRLTGWERTALFRGVFPAAVSAQRRRSVTRRIARRTILVDGYNVLYTISNHLYGRELFLATDGLLRDAGESYDRAPDESTIHRAIDLLIALFEEKAPAHIEVLLDSPKSRSGELASYIRSRFDERGVAGSARTERSVDARLKEHTDAIIATSDSGVIDSLASAARRRVCDMPRMIICRNSNRRVVSLPAVVRRERCYGFLASFGLLRRAR
jgi:hypothetical protein